VRYALHRFFVKEHGWFIRGLEPGNATWSPPPNAPPNTVFVKEWVPTFLQETLEHRSGFDGADIHDLAALAATMEDLVHNEFGERLKLAYEAEEINVDGTLNVKKVQGVMDTFFLTFLLANNFTTRTRKELYMKKHIFSKKYRNYAQVHDWYQKIFDSHFRRSASTEFTFQDVSTAAYEIGEMYHNYNQLDCASLRSTLQGMQSRKPGRVRLSSFYNMSRFSHWRFTEKSDYLQKLGALDVSEPNSPHVIIANYVMARPNCLDASNLYAICCHNACEELMAHLESEMGTFSATPGRIAELVGNLKSDTVVAPRNLSETLLSRLDQVASFNGGEVPIHGRLFAQWMHHAYPLDCPFPHEAGSINPQTHEEWIQGSSVEEVSDDEIAQHVEADACAVNWQGRVECEQESAELPWTMTEELITQHQVKSPQESPRRRTAIYVGIAALSVAAALLFAVHAVSSGKDARQIQRVLGTKFLPGVTAMVLCLMAYAVDLLDGYVLSFVLVGGIAVSAASCRKMYSKQGKELLFYTKGSL